LERLRILGLLHAMALVISALEEIVDARWVPTAPADAIIIAAPLVEPPVIHLRSIEVTPCDIIAKQAVDAAVQGASRPLRPQIARRRREFYGRA
jgi:hypothetical protein